MKYTLRGWARVKAILRDLAYGLHSRFPLCCVLDFVYAVHFERELAATYRWRQFSMRPAERSNIEYVPCRLCLAKIRVGKQEPVTDWCECDEEQRWSCRLFSGRNKKAA